MRQDSLKVINKLNEGLNLTAFVIYKPTGESKMIQDSDYSSKQAFADDLRANEFIVKSVADNRDLYIINNSDYKSLNQLKKEMLKYKKYWDESKQDNPDSTLWKDDYERLKKLYDEAISLVL